MISHRMKRLIKDDINARINFGLYGRSIRRYADAFYSMSPRARRKIRRMSDSYIRLHDARYNDFIGLAMFKLIFMNIALPFLLDIVRGSISSGLTASVKQKVIDPIIDRIISAGKSLFNKKESDSYTDAVIHNISNDFGTLTNALQREGSAVAGKAKTIFDKIKNLV